MRIASNVEAIDRQGECEYISRITYKPGLVHMYSWVAFLGFR